MLAAAAVSLAAEPIQPYITAESEAAVNRGLALQIDQSVLVKPLFNAGVVMNVNNDPDDERNFGKYVEIFTELHYEVEGEPLNRSSFHCLLKYGKHQRKTGRPDNPRYIPSAPPTVRAHPSTLEITTFISIFIP